MSKSNVTPNAASPVNGVSESATTGDQPQVETSKSSGVNWEAMRLPQNFADHIQTRRIAVSVPVRRPDKQSWVYLHPDPVWRRIIGLIDDKVNRRTFAVHPDIQPEIAEDVIPKLLVAYATRQGSWGLWPIRMPDEQGRIDSFNESALAIVSSYSGQWVRILLDQSQGAYYILDTPDTNLTVPKWPEGGMDWLLDLAFRGRVISTLDHPAVLSLRRAAFVDNMESGRRS